MKNTISLVLILLSFTGFAQEIATTQNGKKVILNKNGTWEFLKDNEISEKIVLASDFKLQNGRMSVLDKVCYMKNGDNKITEVLITVGCAENKFKLISIEKINEMLKLVNEKSRSSAKNQYTYSPKVIKLSYLAKEDSWSSTIQFTAQNDYGAVKSGLSSATFDGNEMLINFITL